MPGNRKEGLCCKENICQERETKRKKIHNMKSLKCGGWEETRMSSSETWKQRLAGACLSEKWQRALLEWLSVITSFSFHHHHDELKQEIKQMHGHLAIILGNPKEKLNSNISVPRT